MCVILGTEFSVFTYQCINITVVMTELYQLLAHKCPLGVVVYTRIVREGKCRAIKSLQVASDGCYSVYWEFLLVEWSSFIS